MYTDQILDIIIPFIKATKIDGKKEDKIITGNGIEIRNCSYLLNQILRNISIPEQNYHISKAADELWRSLTSKDIKNFGYDERLLCDKVVKPIKLKKFKGNENDPKIVTVEKDDKNWKYNDFFHNEHIIPINVIIKQLMKCNLDDCNEVRSILNSIHICRVTKEEDKRLKPKSKRPYDLNKILSDIYQKNGVDLL